jgi:CheB methylesterase
MDGGAQQRVVAVGASAGGVKALVRLAAALPRDLGHAVMVLHMPAEAPPSQLARILDRSGPLPAVWAAHGDLIEIRRGGYVLSSFAPKSLPANEIDSTDIVLKLTLADTATDVTSRTTRRATVRFGSGPSRPFTLADRRTTHVRHRHKYADVALPKGRRFYFQAIDDQSVPAAATMHDFRTAPQALQYHLERGDFSRWLEGTIADKDLAAQVAAWEDELLAHPAAHLERIRHQLVQAVEQRYPQ